MKWECNKCGACCQSHDVDEEGRLLDGGPCRNLVRVSAEEYECSIYDDRPWFCRNETGRQYFPDDECHEVFLIEACELLRKKVYGDG